MIFGGNHSEIFMYDLESEKSQNFLTESFANQIDYNYKMNLFGVAKDQLDVDIYDIRMKKSTISLMGHDDFNFSIKFMDGY